MADTDDEFVRFVNEQSPPLYRAARMMTKSPAAAEDLVQDTLVALYPHWDRVSAADSPVAYVRRAMANRFVSSTRKYSREVAQAEPPDIADRTNPTQNVLDRDHVLQLLQGLPARQRAALVLRFLEDMDDVDIANALECRPGTVRSLISRGLAALQQSTRDNPRRLAERNTR